MARPRECMRREDGCRDSMSAKDKAKNTAETAKGKVKTSGGEKVKDVFKK